MNRISRPSLNLSFFQKKPTEYHYIQDFENTNEKICKKCDKDNDSIYARNFDLYTKTKKYLEKNNAIFKMEGPPSPPRVPSNYELFVIHRNRNSNTNNKIQTISILYLLHRGYRLVIDPGIELLPKVMNKDNKLFEPYMAIDIASSLNKNFVKEIAKTYELKGDRLGSPELLSFEEKLEKFNREGMIEYLEICEETNMKRETNPSSLSLPTHALQSQLSEPSSPLPIDTRVSIPVQAPEVRVLPGQHGQMPTAPMPTAPMPTAPMLNAQMPTAPMLNAQMPNQQYPQSNHSVSVQIVTPQPEIKQNSTNPYAQLLENGQQPPAYSTDNK